MRVQVPAMMAAGSSGRRLLVPAAELEGRIDIRAFFGAERSTEREPLVVKLAKQPGSAREDVVEEYEMRKLEWRKHLLSSLKSREMT